MDDLARQQIEQAIVLDSLPIASAWLVVETMARMTPQRRCDIAQAILDHDRRAESRADRAANIIRLTVI